MKPLLALAAVLVPLLLVATVQADEPYPVYVTPVPAAAPPATVYSGPVTVVQRPRDRYLCLPVGAGGLSGSPRASRSHDRLPAGGERSARADLRLSAGWGSSPGCSGGRLLLAVDRLGGAGTRTARAQLLSSDHSLTSPFEKG